MIRKGSLTTAAVLLLSLAGMFLSANLLAHHVDAKSAGLLSSFCGENQSGCSEVLGGRWAVFPPAAENASASPSSASLSPASGVPVAMLGLFYFSFVCIWWLFIGRPGWDQRWWQLIPTVLVVAGCIASLSFIWIMVNQIKTWCPLCLATHAINFALLPCVILSWPNRPSLKKIDDSAGPIVAHPSLRLASSVVAMCAVLCVGIWFGTASLALQSEKEALAQEVARFREDTDIVAWLYERQPEQKIVVRDDDPIVPATSPKKATLVLFTDFQCPFCRDFEDKLLREIYPQFRGHLEIVFKHYPLCRECNEEVKSDMHPLSCEAAYLAEAARLQGGMPAFIKMIAALSEPRERMWSVNEIELIARRLELDSQRLQEDRRSKAIGIRISEDIALGNQLKVDGTPTAFLNGRKLETHWSHLPVFWELMAANYHEGTDEGQNESAELVGHLPAVGDSSGQPPNQTDLAAIENDTPDQLIERGNHFAEVLIRKYDADSDGKLQKKEWTDLPATFVRYDADTDETVTKAEISQRFVRLYSSFKRRTARRELDEGIFNERVKIGGELEIVGPTLDHGSYDLKQQRGKVVLVKFWASWCPHCRDETPVLLDLYERHHADGFEVVGVSLDKSKEELASYISEAKVIWPQIFFDREDGGKARNPLADRYGVVSIPTMILIGRDGKIARVKPRGPSLKLAVADLVGTEASTKEKSNSLKPE